MTKIWKEVKYINKPNALNGIRELYNQDGNATMNTDELIEIVNKHISETFHTDNDDSWDILNEIKNLESKHQYSSKLNNLTKIRNNSLIMKYQNSKQGKKHKITHIISKTEIAIAIKSQKNDKSTGNDWIPSEIFKQNINKWSEYLEKYYNSINNNDMPNEWKQGVITLIPKSGDSKNIKNYRPITLLNTIYKIWATIMTNKLKPYMNLLTCEMQHGYKINKSATDIIFHIKRNIIKNNINGQILLDLSKAFGRIDRTKLWDILYEKGLPIELIDLIKKGHTGNYLCSKINNQYTKLIKNNIGVFQGSPLSACLFIIYADYVMNEYKNEIKQTNTQKSTNVIKNIEAELNWTKNLIDEPTIINNNTNTTNNDTNTSKDYVLFADDTAIEFKNNDDIIPKLTTYDKVSKKSNFLINWAKVYILANKKNIRHIEDKINNSNSPIKNIKCTNSTKILGRIMNADEKMDNAIKDRINKANTAWRII